jgi:NAD(P)-dependent dehydrogenase (short-subunit alcohol dehydrogenase family)
LDKTILRGNGIAAEDVTEGSPMHDLTERIAVVTGAASGIGHALAERFAAEGMRVVLADIEEEALARAEATLRAGGATTLAVRTDVGRAADVETLAQKTLSRFGALHVVCNNAGVGGDAAPAWEQTLDGWRWVVDVNLWGVIHGIRTFVPLLLEQRTEGHVVNTASMAGHLAMPMLSPYHATKFAVVSLSECLHHELTMSRAQVGVSVLCPGFVRTRIMSSERNRPGPPPPDRSLSEAAQALRSAYEAMIESGLPPERVAGCVVEAIRTRRFWIFPHPELLPAIQSRAEEIVAQRNPGMTLPPELREPLKV